MSEKKSQIEKDQAAGIIFCSLPSQPSTASSPLTPTAFSTPFSKKKDKEPTSHTISALRTSLNEAETTLRSKGIPEVKAATLEKIVSLLLHPSYGTRKYKKTVLLMRPTFCSSIEFFNSILSKFEPNPDEKHKKEGRSAVVSVLFEWMKGYYEEDWRDNKEVQEAFDAFMKQISSAKTFEFIEIRKQLTEERTNLEKNTLTPPSACGWKDLDSSNFNFSSLSVSQIADTITCYAFQLLQATRQREHLAWLGTEKGKREEVGGKREEEEDKENSSSSGEEGFPHIQELIDFFNRLSSWSSREVATKPKKADRVQMVTRLIQIASKLYDTNNFLCAKAIVIGLSTSYIRRMKRTFEAVPQDDMAKLENLEKNLSIQKNFKHYRQVMDASSPPCIPYLGMYQRDILFLNDGNPNEISKLINFSKRTRIAEIIFDVSFCNDYGGRYSSLVPVPELISWLLSFPIMSDKEIYLWARRVEPKDTEMVIGEMLKSEMDHLREIEDLRKIIQEQKEKIAYYENESKELVLKERRKRKNRRSPNPNPLSPSNSPLSSSPPSYGPTLSYHHSLPAPASPTKLALDMSQCQITGPSFSSPSPFSSSSPSDPPSVVPRKQPLPPPRSPPEDRAAIAKRKREERESRFTRVGSTLQGSKNRTPPAHWSVEEVCTWVESLVGSEWVIPFLENQILGADLMEMGKEEISLFIDNEEICEKIYRTLCTLRWSTEKGQSSTRITLLPKLQQQQQQQQKQPPPRPAKTSSSSSIPAPPPPPPIPPRQPPLQIVPDRPIRKVSLKAVLPATLSWGNV